MNSWIWYGQICITLINNKGHTPFFSYSAYAYFIEFNCSVRTLQFNYSVITLQLNSMKFGPATISHTNQHPKQGTICNVTARSSITTSVMSDILGLKIFLMTNNCSLTGQMHDL